MAYLDGELSPEAAAAMTAHLTECRLCQDVAADLQGVSRQLSGWAVEPVGEGIPANIARTLDEKPKRGAPVRRWRFAVGHPWAVVAAVGVVLVAAFFLPTWNARRAPTLSKQADMAVPSSMNERLENYASLQRPAPLPDAGLLVVRTVELNVTARHFDTLRTDLDRILLQFGGHIAQLNVASPTGEGRNLNATLRVPWAGLDAALAELRKLGRVNSESLRGEEVTQQSVDLEARLSNARHTEERLTQILATRAGKLSEVLEVEQKLAEVRGEIERAEAERKSLNNRISFATVSLAVSEDSARLSSAAVEGLHTAFDSFIGLIRVLLAAGPSLLLFSALLALPAYFLWKKLRH